MANWTIRWSPASGSITLKSTGPSVEEVAAKVAKKGSDPALRRELSGIVFRNARELTAFIAERSKAPNKAA